MNRRAFLCSALAAVVPARAQTKKRPNILLLFSDDHAWQAVSAYGGKLNETPNIDRIAHEGMLFDNCLVTNSICAPSRATILTGKYSHVNGVIDNAVSFDGSQPTFPQLLQRAGYQTAMFGKWHLKTNPTGFDTWEILPGQGNYYNPDFLTPTGRKGHEGYCTDVVAQLSIDWLKNRDKTKPFLLMSQHKAPHRNWFPAPEQLSRYEGVTFPEPPNLFDDYKDRATPAATQELGIDKYMGLTGDLKLYPMPGGEAPPQQVKQFMSEYGRMTPAQKKMFDAANKRRIAEYERLKPTGRELVSWKYQQYMKDYLRCVAALDEAVGSVLRYLDAEGLAEDTVVIYASDQGFFLGEHGYYDKRWIYEESLRTPFMVRWPGVTKPASRASQMVSNVDFAETILDAGGAPVPADMHGKSLVPILRGEKPKDWRKSFYYHYYEDTVHGVARHYGVRTDRYTLAHYYTRNEWELFDREKDPRQMRSVYAQPEYASVVRELKTELARLRKELKVPEKDPDKK